MCQMRDFLDVKIAPDRFSVHEEVPSARQGVSGHSLADTPCWRIFVQKLGNACTKFMSSLSGFLEWNDRAWDYSRASIVDDCLVAAVANFRRQSFFIRPITFNRAKRLFADRLMTASAMVTKLTAIPFKLPA